MSSQTESGAGAQQRTSKYDLLYQALYKSQLEEIDAQLKESQAQYDQALLRFSKEHEVRMEEFKRRGSVTENDVRWLRHWYHTAWNAFSESRIKAHGELLGKRALIQAAASVLLPASVDWAAMMAAATKSNAQKHEERVRTKAARAKAAREAETAAMLAKMKEMERKLAAMEAEAEQQRRRAEQVRRAAEEAIREKEREEQLRREQARRAEEAQAQKQLQEQERKRKEQERKEQERKDHERKEQARKEQARKEQARKEQARKDQARQEQEAKARKEQKAKARREQEAREKRETSAISLDQARDHWERAWNALLAPMTRSAKELHYEDIPWPGATGLNKPIDLSSATLRRFLLEPTAKDRLAAKLQCAGKAEAAVLDAIVSARLRTALLRFHPDKFFSSRCFSRVRNNDQERVRKGVVQVAQVLTALVCERRGAGK